MFMYFKNKFSKACVYIKGENVKLFSSSTIQNVLNPYSFTIMVPIRIPIRQNSYYKYNFSPEVEAAINKQIQAEQQAAQDYLNMAVAFLHPCLSRPGAGGFYMKMYYEELGHMQDFIQYQLLRGGTPVIKGLTAPKPNVNLTLLDAFKKALEMEKSVTKLLAALVLVAESVKDHQCADYVTSVFLAEQMRSVNEISHHITKLSRLCDEHAIYHYDLQLLKDHPYSHKSQMPT